MIENTLSLLVLSASRHPKKVAIIHGNISITYEQLLHAVREQAAILTNRGITKGDAVLVFIPMSIELYVSLMAIFYCGAYGVFMDAWAGKKRIIQALTIIPCKGFIGVPRAHLLRCFIPIMQQIPIKLFPLSPFCKMLRNEYSPPASVSSNDTALCTFTTGSTGLPKAAKRTHGFLFAQHRIISEHFKQQEDDIELITLPIFILNTLAIGATAVIPAINPSYPQKVHSYRIYSDLKKHKVSTAIGSPIFFEKLADFCYGRTPLQLKKIFLGGAPVFPHIAKKLITTFPNCSIEIVYGSTEAEPIASIDAVELAASTSLQHIGLMVGTPIKAIELKIVPIFEGPLSFDRSSSIDTMALPAHSVGEIIVTGEHVLKEYFNCPQAELINKIKSGSTIWHRTGDAGYLNDQGQLFLMGRSGGRITMNGKTFFQFPIEMMLAKFTEISIGTIIDYKSKAFIIIEPKNPKTIGLKEIAMKLNVLDLPKYVLITVPKIPRDPRHHSKIDYDRLQALLIKKGFI